MPEETEKLSGDAGVLAADVLAITQRAVGRKEVISKIMRRMRVELVPKHETEIARAALLDVLTILEQEAL